MKLILEGMVNGKYMRKSLDEQTSGVGRGSQNEVQLVDRSVSREHATLRIQGDELVVEDLNSRNGTFVNGKRIEGPTSARTGDKIRFGAIDMSLLSPDAPVTPYKPVPTMLAQPERLQTTTRLTWDELKQSGVSTADVSQTSGLFQVLVETGPLLVQPRPLEEVFEAVLDLIERVVTARRVLLLLREDEKSEPVLKAARPAGSSADEQLMLSQGMMEVVLKERTSLLVNDAQSDPRFMERQSIVAMDIRSALVAPLFDNEKVIGLIYVDTNDPIVRFDDNQLRALYMLANLVAIKITQTKLLEEQRIKERMEQELATGARIQRSLLPKQLPEIEGYEIYADQWACLETAGDLYDVNTLDDGTISLVVGDVSGKGLGAALLMSNVLASLRILYGESITLSETMERLNMQLQKATEETSFVTIFFARLDQRNHQLHYVNAGHNPPYLISTDGAVKELRATGIPAGMMPGVPYQVGTVEFPPGSLLFVFTDGIPEAAVNKEFYDEERMLQSVRRRFEQPIEEVASGILDDLYDFLGKTPPGDDITMLLLRRKA